MLGGAGFFVGISILFPILRFMARLVWLAFLDWTLMGMEVVVVVLLVLRDLGR